MKKCGKTALSLLLSVSMGVATVTPVMASPARGEPELNPLVAVIEKVNSGDTLNLTEEGTLDWVHITGKEINRKSGDEELIQWENLDADSALSTAGDSAMAYTWTDGTPVVEKTNDTHAGVFNYRGIETGVVEEDAGYRISIPAADETRTLTFVSGIWQASAEIGITVNEDEKPVYTTQLKAGGSAEMNKYTVTVREGNEVTITTKIKEKTHKDGNLSLGGIALKTVEPSPIAVKVQDVSSLPKLNLTERGDVDWIHFEGEKGVSQEGVGTTVRKKDVDSQVTYQKLIGLIDDTYAHGFERREEVSDTIYNFGGYPHGYYSSAYNAGYGSTALRGEEYRDAGIKAYQFMIQNAMSGPFGWWEGVDYQSDDSPWDVAHAKGGGGSCQHMWGQSTASKVLIDALIAEKINDKIIIGRGVPKEWITANQTFSVSNHVVEQGKKVGYAVQTSPDGKEVTITFTGDQTTIPFSVELINFKNNIASVSGNFEFDQEAGIVTVPAGTKSVTVTLKSAYDKDAAAELEKADKRLKAALSKVQEKEEADYTKTSYEIMKQASDEGEALLEDAERTAVLVNAAAEKTEQAIKNLVPIYVDYDVVDTSGNKEGSAYRVGQKSDQYMRYQTFFANHTGVLEKVEVKVRREKDPSDLIVKVYSLQENHKDLGEELASAVIPAENANGIVRVVFENAPTLNEGEAYAILLGQETPDNSNVYVWSHVENTDSNIFSVKVSNNNGELSYKDETQTIGTAWFRAVIANYNKTKLEEMIQEAEKLDSEEYTEESFANLQKALEEAGNVLANMNADKEMVVGAEESLKTALEALQKADQEADKADLEALIEYANSQKGEEEYQWVVKAVKEAFEKALADAEAVNMNESATQEEVDAAYELLLGRVHLLGFIGNPTNLKVTLDLAKETSTEGKTEESVAILNAAIEKAETLLKTENVLQEEMEAMVAELKAAIEGLKDEVVVEVDKSDLLELIKKAEGCDLTKYTPVTVEGLKTALVGAKEVYDNPDATQKEVDSAYQSLHQAIFGLRLIPNKDALEELIKETEKIDFSLYTEESAATVQKAYNRAKAVFEDKNAVQEEVDKAEKELKVAKDNLVLKDDEDKTPSKDQNTGASSNQKPVQTGDNMSTGALAGIVVAAVLAMGAIAGVMFSKKRKK